MYTYDDNLYSDLHKNAYGFRPRDGEYMRADPNTKQAMWDQLCKDNERAMKEYHAEEERKKNSFEELVSHYIVTGAGSRHRALVWIVQSAGLPKDELEFYGASSVLFELNIPYDYEQEFRQPVREVIANMKD